MKNLTRATALLLFGSLMIFGTTASHAQEGVKRTDLQKNDLSIPGREVVQQMVEFQPGVVVDKHTHPGEEVTVVLEGALLLEVAGKPAATYRAGQAFTVPPGVVHGAKSTGAGATKLLATYIVEKGKPLRSPAP
jgi:quercetin dioxygenase-like cupin family protein